MSLPIRSWQAGTQYLTSKSGKTRICSRCEKDKKISHFHHLPKPRQHLRMAFCTSCTIELTRARRTAYDREHGIVRRSHVSRLSKSGKTKICNLCLKRKKIGRFSTQWPYKHRHSSRCKNCAILAIKKWVQEHPEEKKLGSARKRLAKYGLTLESFDALKRRQKNRCAICNQLPWTRSKKHKTLHVDHDHVSGIVRGLLCRPCNVGIGHLAESEEILRAAIKYLKKGRVV